MDIYLTENVGIAGSTPALSDVKFKDYANGIYVAAGLLCDDYRCGPTFGGGYWFAPATLADGVVYRRGDRCIRLAQASIFIVEYTTDQRVWNQLLASVKEW